MCDNYDFSYYCDSFHFGKNKGDYSTTNHGFIENIDENQLDDSARNSGDILKEN